MKNISKSAALCALPILSVACSSENKVQTGDKPNVVFLLFDDLGYGDLGCYGQKQIETPNIDALASQGVLFTDMYTAVPLSAPSRCSILTGLHSGHSQIRNNADRCNPAGYGEFDALTSARRAITDPEQYAGQWPMREGTQTIGTMMQAAGYRTGMIGKWGLGYEGVGSVPRTQGFDYFYGFLCQAVAHIYYPKQLWENDQVIEFDNRLMLPGERLEEGADPMNLESYRQWIDKYYSPDLMYEKIEKFVSDESENPFFLMWTTTVPHSAVQAPWNEVQYYVDKLGDEEPVTEPGNYLPNRYPHATYAAMVTHIDTQVGKLVEYLREIGKLENTLFIVTSDNGPANNSNSPLEYFQSGGPFRCRKGWGKSSLHEGGIRMPFIVSWPGHIAPSRTERLSSFTDIMPTLADLAGTQAPENDGQSLLPTLQGKNENGHEFLYWEYPGGKGWLAVREGKWKGIIQRVKEGNAEFELFDLENDPQEQNNVAAEHPEITQKMWQRIRESHVDNDMGIKAFTMPINFPGGEE